MTTPTIFAGTSLASSVSQGLALNDPTIATSNNSSNSDRFWSSQKQDINSPVKEVLEMNFSTASLTNRISFEIAKFPQKVWVEYTVDSGNTWIPVVDALTNNPATVSILKSYPVVLPSPIVIEGHAHPQHDYDGHWQRVDIRCLPVEIQRLRFVLQRDPAGQAPVDTNGEVVPYSLAIQDINVGYEISSKSDIPRTNPESTSATSNTVFANSTDLFGSNLGFSTKTYLASNLINSNDTSSLLWKSEPQPFTKAVVNFYADLRNRDGQGQAIDRIFIDPIYDGPHVTLYYSNDNTAGTFLSGREPLNSQRASLTNAKVNNDKLDLTGNAFVQVDNGYLSFDPSQDWWMGVQFTVSNQLADGLNHPIMALRSIETGFNASGVYLTTPQDSVVLESLLDPMNDGVPINMIAAYKSGNLYLTVTSPTIDYTSGSSTSKTVSVPIDSSLPPQLFIGTDTTNTKFFGQQISAFVLKQETLTDDNTFLEDPASYSVVPNFVADEDASKFNALLRFDPSNVADNVPSGLIGSPAFNFENLNWTPIPREYEMHRGYMQLPLTQAKFWNLEITNLRPEITEKFVPVTRSVKLFPPEVVQSFVGLSDDRSSSDDLGSDVQQQLSNAMAFSDIPTYIGTGGTSTGYTNTEVYVADDLQTQSKLAELGNAWQYQQWRADRQAPRFNRSGQHNYTIEEVTQYSHVSYFAGLRQIIFCRQTNTSPQDQAFIEESFVDDSGVNIGNWNLVNDQGLFSGQGSGQSYARTSSVNIPTQRPIRGLQFASQQSDAQHINVSGDFSDVNYDPNGVNSWSTVGDGKILGLILESLSGSNSLLVSRQTNRGFWADIGLKYKIWGGISTGHGYQPGFESLSFPTSTSTLSLTHQGIQQSSIVVQSQDGYTTYSLNSDYTIFATDGSNPTSETTISILPSGSMPTATPISIFYEYADTAHPVGMTFGELSVGSIEPSYEGGITSGTFAMPLGGRIHAAARVTTNKPLSEPLWIQILDADTGGVLSEEPSGVAKNEVNEWYTSLDIDTFGGKIGLKWGDLVGKKTWQTFKDDFTRTNAPNPGSLVTGQSWVTPSGYVAMTIASNTLTSTIDYSSRAEINTGTPWGILDITLGTTPTTSTAILMQIGGNFTVTNLGAVSTTDNNSTVFNLSTVPASGVRYRFKFMPTQFVPAGQTMAGADPVVQPYSILVFTLSGPVSSPTETWVQTYSGAHAFGSVQALMGIKNQQFTYFKWTPSNTPINTSTAIPIPPLWSNSILQSSDNKVYTLDQQTTSGIRRWILRGNYTQQSVGSNVYRYNSAPPVGYTEPGTMLVTDVRDQYGALEITPYQVIPSGTVPYSGQSLATIDYDLNQNQWITLQADGSIFDQVNQTTLKASMFTGSPTGKTISIRYVNAQTLAPSFKTTWSITTQKQAIVILQANVVKGVYAGNNIWKSTTRGIAGAYYDASNYVSIMGPSWNPDASMLAQDSSGVTWANVSYNDTRTYGQMSNTIQPSTRNIAIRLVQKKPTLDYWFVQSATPFWDPVVWEFSCDGGTTWWKAEDIRNNPRGALLFPYQLNNYSNLRWRVTSYSGNVHVSNLTIRPWYQGFYRNVPPRPTQLPVGPNLVPTDHYGPIEKDPKWKVWNKPIPRSWWFDFQKLSK